jgi:hypothetical protein
MACRGGAVRRRVDDVDLTDMLTEHVREFGVARAMSFGVYENIDRSQAAFAQGLAHNKVLLTKVVQSNIQYRQDVSAGSS